MATPAGIERQEKTHETPQKAANGGEEAPSAAPVRDESHVADDALRAAVKAALDAGLYDRARALLDVLARTPAIAPVVDLEKRRK